MSLKVDKIQLEIIIKKNSAQKQLGDLEEKMAATRKKAEALKKQFGESSEEYKKNWAELEKLNKQYGELTQKIGLTGMSMQQLRKRKMELDTVLRNIPGNAAEFAKYKKELEAVEARMKELKGTATETRSTISRLSEGFSKYAGMATAAVASLGGVAFSVQKCVDSFMEMQEEEANVRKYTGMTADEVEDLNEALKKMDTRAPRERLNQLAADAGRLGITSKEAILDFIEAANIINVSLGEDLGQDAIKNIGKLSTMFGDDKRMGLRGAMLAVGSAINELAQNSSASEPYLSNFTARLAGVANQAHLTVAQVMGFGSVLDQNMMQVEMSSTALQGLLMKVFKEPERLAKIAGMNVQAFTELVKKDANEALLQLLDTLGKTGDMNALAPIFEEMKLDGARSSAVLAVLAGQVNKVRHEQELATQAFADGQSVVDEYNVQNNTLQAGMEKAKKNLKEVSIQLGEKFYPYMQMAVTGTGNFLQILLSLVGLIGRYSTALTAATVTIGAYVVTTKLAEAWTNRFNAATLAGTAYQKAAIVVEKLHTAQLWLMVVAKQALEGRATRLTRTFSSLWKVLAVNPIGAIVAAITALTYASYKLTQAYANKYKQETINKEIAEETNEAYNKQKDLVQRLTDIIHDNNRSTLERKNAIEELKKIMPEYNAEISSEGKVINENTEAAKKYNAELYKTMQLKTMQKKMEELQSDLELHSKTRKSEGPNLMGSMARMDQQEKVANIKKAMADLQAQMDKLANSSAKAGDAAEEAAEQTAVAMAAAAGGGSGSKTDPVKVREDAMREAKLKELAALEQMHYEGTISEEEYQDKLYDIDIRYLQMRKMLYEEFGKDSSQTQIDMYNRMSQYADQLNKRTKASGIKDVAVPDEEDTGEDNYLIEKFKASLDGRQALLDAYYEQGLISKEQYEDECTRIQQEKTKERQEILTASLQVAAQVMATASQAVQALQDIEIQKVESKYDKQIKAAQKAGKDTTKLEEKKEAEVNAIKKKYADAQFAAQVLQVTSSTAVAAMEAYKAMAGIPVVGPALGAAAAAAAVASGAIQIAQAKASRDQAKGLYSGGYSDDYVQGYTTTGDPTQVAGVIPVHKNEFVGNHQGVANPAVKQFYDVFDAAQKDGSIGVINTTQILQRVMGVGYAKGGYSSGGEDNGTTGAASIVPSDYNRQLEQIANLLRSISENAMTVREVRDELKRVDRSEARARRGSNYIS